MFQNFIVNSLLLDNLMMVNHGPWGVEEKGFSVVALIDPSIDGSAEARNKKIPMAKLASAEPMAMLILFVITQRRLATGREVGGATDLQPIKRMSRQVSNVTVKHARHVVQHFCTRHI